MFDGLDQSKGGLDNDEAFDLLQELEQNRTEDIRRQRSHFRLALKTSVILTAGNASERLTFKVKGVSGDISEGGTSILFPIPVGVGDIYRLQFEDEALELPLTFARCVRCRLVREDAYEAGFSFFKSITLPENIVVSCSSQ